MNSLLVVITALAVSLAVIALMVRLAPVLGMIDRPNARKLHLHPIPRVGGWGIICGALVAVAAWLPFAKIPAAFMMGAVVLLIAGALDDSRDLKPVTKLLLQIAAAAVALAYAGLVVTSLPTPVIGQLDIPYPLAVVLTGTAFVACINATNTSDGLDGLAGGLTLLSLCGFVYLAYATGSTELLLISASAVGGLFGFLRYNTHPAIIFMGDCGSQFLGFALAFLGLALLQTEAAEVSPWTVLMIMGLPLADLAVVAIRRIIRGASCFKADRTHIHHRFLDLGLTHTEAVILIYGIQTSLVFFAVALRPSNDWKILLAYALHLVVVYGFLFLAEETMRRNMAASQGANPHGRFQPTAMAPVRVWAPRVLLETLIPLILVTFASLATEIPRDVGALGAVLMVPLAVTVYRRSRSPSLLARLPTYVIAAATIYLYTDNRPFVSEISRVTEIGGFLAVAVAVALALRFSPRRRTREFLTTATDYLLIMVICFTAFGLYLAPAPLSAYFLVYFPIVLYGCEVLLIERREKREWLLLGALIASVILAIRGLG